MSNIDNKTVINNFTGGGTLQTWPDGEWQILYAKDSAGNVVTLSLTSHDAIRLAYAVSPIPNEQFERMRAATDAVYQLSYPEARADELRQTADVIDCGGGCERCSRGEFCDFVAANNLRDLGKALDLKASLAPAEKAGDAPFDVMATFDPDYADSFERYNTPAEKARDELKVACASCKKIPGPHCQRPTCAFRDYIDTRTVKTVLAMTSSELSVIPASAVESGREMARQAIAATPTPPIADVEIGAVSGDGSPETIKFDGRWFDRRETVDALTSLLAEARAANWHGADGVLEVIAKRLEAWDTTDIWRSDAAGLVRSYKQSAAHGGGTKSDGGVEGES